MSVKWKLHACWEICTGIEPNIEVSEQLDVRRMLKTELSEQWEYGSLGCWSIEQNSLESWMEYLLLT